MKIGIASIDENENSIVSKVSGRAPFYLIYENGKLIKTIKNPFMVGGGAGISVAQMLSNEGVEFVIAGTFGNNMVAMLETKNIKYKEVQDKTIKQIIEEMN